MKNPKLISLFCGVGGIDQGFNLSGFKTVFANDNNKIACESFGKNFPETKTFCSDVNSVNYLNYIKKNQVIDGVIGGPPCPSFSKSRFYLKDKKRAMEDEIGFNTISNYFRAVETCNPKFFFFENVHGFVYKPHQSSFDFLKKKSHNLGYKIFYND